MMKIIFLGLGTAGLYFILCKYLPQTWQIATTLGGVSISWMAIILVAMGYLGYAKLHAK